MKAFVIDEGVLHLAQAGTDDRGEVNYTAATFLLEVCQNGHKVCWSNATLSRMRKKLKRWEGNRVPALNVVKLVHQFLLEGGRYIHVDVSGVTLPAEIPTKDADWVKVAIAKKLSILVTQDEPLRKKIRKASLTKRGVRVEGIDVGLDLARDPDC